MHKPAQLTQIDLDDLRQGVTLETPLFDPLHSQQILLLAEGTVLTSSLIETLRRRGIQKVLIASEHVARVTRLLAPAPLSVFVPPTSKSLESKKQEPKAILIGNTPFLFREKKLRENTLSTLHDHSFWHDCSEPKSLSLPKSLVVQMDQLTLETMARLCGLYAQAEMGDISSFDQSIDICNQALNQLTKDIDTFVAGCTNLGSYTPSLQGTSSAMLAVAIGNVHGLTRDELIELGVGIMLHEAGMLLLERGNLELSSIIDDLSFLELSKHSSYAADMIGRAKNMPRTSQMVAYQIHERCDGSGYPRRRHDNQIHLLAKIAAIADHYIALTTPRPKYQPLSSYHAMEQILHDARKHKFDQNVARSFLYTMSLFPVGSLVELSDGRIGRVTRSNLEKYTRPMLEVISLETVFEPTHTINLASEKGLDIIRPLSDLLIYDDRLVGV